MSPASSGTSGAKWIIEDRDLVDWVNETIPHLWSDDSVVRSLLAHFEMGWELSSVEYGVIYLHHPGGHKLIPDESDRRFRLL